MRVRAPSIEKQLVSVFRAWGMSDAHADTTATVMVETDLRGVDSHGISMLPTYDQEFRQGRFNMRPVSDGAAPGRGEPRGCAVRASLRWGPKWLELTRDCTNPSMNSKRAKRAASTST